MSTSIKAAQLVIARVSALAAAIFVFAAITATPSHAQNVVICSLYGAGFFYIPGTDTCTYAQQIVDSQFAIARATTYAATGTAAAARWSRHICRPAPTSRSPATGPRLTGRMPPVSPA